MGLEGANSHDFAILADSRWQWRVSALQHMYGRFRKQPQDVRIQLRWRSRVEAARVLESEEEGNHLILASQLCNLVQDRRRVEHIGEVLCGKLGEAGFPETKSSAQCGGLSAALCRSPAADARNQETLRRSVSPFSRVSQLSNLRASSACYAHLRVQATVHIMNEFFGSMAQGTRSCEQNMASFCLGLSCPGCWVCCCCTASCLSEIDASENPGVYLVALLRGHHPPGNLHGAGAVIVKIL